MQIARCCAEIHRCESELAGDKTGTGAWLGYMDWLEELHYQIHEGETVDRKQYPMFSGLLKYFPDALQYVSHVSFVGNQQHNAGEPLHWAREKSTDEPDALLRHLKDAGTLDTDGLRHSGKVAWRALAMLQKEIEAERK